MCNPHSFLKCKCHLVFDCKTLCAWIIKPLPSLANTTVTTSLSFTLVTWRTLCSFNCELFSAHSLPLCAHCVSPPTSDLCPHCSVLYYRTPTSPPTQSYTHLLSHETKKTGVLKINHDTRESMHVYLCARERTEKKGKNKVSMETKELCLIGNNTSKRSEIRNHKAGLAQPYGYGWHERCHAQSTLLSLFINAFLFIYRDWWRSICPVQQEQNGFWPQQQPFLCFVYFWDEWLWETKAGEIILAHR